MEIKYLIFFLNTASLYAANFEPNFGINGVETSFSHFMRELKELPLELRDSIEEKWITQPLNHFNPSDRRTWNMKFYQNLDFFQPNGPIYVVIGGEGPADSAMISNGMNVYQLAQETNGALFGTEHRYYGESIPLDPENTENLRYLRSEQALADLAYFIKTLKRSPQFLNSKVVVIGGSYAGSLAAWMRQLYPNLVDAAIASSAPVLAKVDFHEYYEKVAEDIKKYGSQECFNKVAQMFYDYEQLLETPGGKEQLMICDDVDMTNPANKAIFYYVKMTSFGTTAQYGKPRSIKEMCDGILNNEQLNNLYMPQFIESSDISGKCYRPELSGYVNWIKSHNISCAWIYQTCTEFGYFMTSTLNKKPFGEVSVQYYEEYCAALFGPQFNENTINDAVDSTNKLYGGLHAAVTQVVFLNGDMDPWSTLGVGRSYSYTAPALMIPGSSHCRDMFADRQGDPQELIYARAFAREQIKAWIGF